jgi:hypothetical protein
MTSWLFVAVQKSLQNDNFTPGSTRGRSLMFMWVGVLLV